MRFVQSLLLVLALTNLSLPFARAQMLGRQSQNEGIRAVPAPAAVTIDGDLSDWDLSGRIWSFADIAIRDRYSAETAAMWDHDFLYLAVHFQDPNPLVNTINPIIDAGSGWKGDALQLRLLTDWPSWVTLWHSTNQNRGVMQLSVWKTPNESRVPDETFFTGEPGSIQIGRGVEMAFKADANGRGYVQEARIPWNVIYKKTPEVAAGLTFRMGLEFFWGRASNTVWPAHRYADNLQPGETNREFFWTAKNSWGDVTLMKTGNVKKIAYLPPDLRLEGTIPLRFEIPATARQFTVVVETPDGRRLRNVGAQLDAEMYSLSTDKDRRTVEVLWDGLDDTGKAVPAGTYRVRGLSHEGLGADYVMSFFNPGTPPWESGASGSWGADHASPQYVTTSGDWTFLGWSVAEGGSGIVAVGPDGLKKWGELRGVQAIAADEGHVYFSAHGWRTAGELCRLDKKTGAYRPFVVNGQELPFELPLATIFGGKDAVPGQLVSLASSGRQLALSMSGGKIALLDPASAALLKTFDVPSPGALAFDATGKLYALSGLRLAEVDLATGALRFIPTPGLTLKTEVVSEHEGVVETTPAIGTLAIDPQGNLGLFDDGPDQQVKFYSASGEFQYAVGRKGGRPIRGDFDEQAMIRVSAAATDSKGQTWVTENWEYPRRVSVWGRDGRLVRDYVGNTGYAGTGTFLHDEDPTLAYYGPVEMKLDLEKHTWKVQRVLWVPGEGEQFPVYTPTNTPPHRFSSTAGGKKREFMYVGPMRRYASHVLYMEGDTGWRPVAAVGFLGQLSGKLDRTGKVIAQPTGEYAGGNAYDGYFWNDLNRDGRVQRSEVEIVPTPKPVPVGQGALANEFVIPYGSGWGSSMAREDLSFFVNGTARYVPLRYTDEGAPIYGPASIQRYVTKSSDGDYVPLLAENSVVALFGRGNFATTGIHALDAKTGEEKWSYPNPFPSVHGSHLAPMPRAGLVIGPLRILGVAPLDAGNGYVFGLRGNLGQDFYFTSDGLMIGTIFQDGRLPTLPLPEKESDLYGSPMESFGGGAEPFSGWFGRQVDGKVRFTNGLAGQTAFLYEMKGLDRIRRFNAPDVRIDEHQVALAAVANDARAAARKTVEKRQIITKLAPPPSLDGGGAGWKTVKPFVVESISSGFKARARLAYDATHLYLSMDVDDPSPWKNEGANIARLFKTGDAVDLQFATNPAAPAKRTVPAAGDLRVLLAPFQKQAVAVLMQAVNPAAPATVHHAYSSPVGTKTFDEVRPLSSVQITVVPQARGYLLTAAFPLAELGLKPVAGAELRGDLGFISSDAEGRANIARTYWSNQATNLVADEPLEAWLYPASWGVFLWGE